MQRPSADRWQTTLHELLESCADGSFHPQIGFNRAMACWSQGRAWKPVLILLDDMAARRAQRDVFSTTYAITAASHRHWRGAVAMLRSCEEATAASWSAVMRAGEAAEEGWRRSLGLLAAMPLLNGGLRQDVVCYSAVMSACGHHCTPAWKAGLDCRSRMASARIRQNVVILGTVAAICAALPAWHAALEVLREMAADQGQPSEILCDTCILACDTSGRWSKALETFIDSEAAGIDRSPVAFLFILARTPRSSTAVAARLQSSL
ncbi:petH [Symbiodinium natans]|uniref:PetH protein n=1 Tax=Symbiodinium natans TaxID=878477 RepID=A0A812QSJ0_9DINO|nr:petH [Symbiodinium natans]